MSNMETVSSLQYSLFSPETERNRIVQSNYIGWSIILSYIIFTKVVGPNIMKTRKPMDLKLTMVVFNSILVALNAYLACQAGRLARNFWHDRCEMNSIIKAEWSKYQYIGMFGFLVKFLELFDTVIFILRKKFQQVSFLHVFHHTVVFGGLWVSLKYKMIGFYVILTGVINFSVHVVLYSYYALSALGPEVRKHLWWKKYLTWMQIVQFLIIMVYMIFSSLSGCQGFNAFDTFCFVSLILITILFLNFYVRTYKATKKLN